MALLIFNNGTASSPQASGDNRRTILATHSSLKEFDFSSSQDQKNTQRETQQPPSQGYSSAAIASPNQKSSYINTGKNTDSLENRRRLKASHIMTSPVLTAKSHELITSCHQKMHDSSVSHIVIINHENNPLAIVDETDLLAVSSPDSVFIQSILTPKALAVSEDTLVRDVALTFMKYKASAIAVVDSEHHLSGIISRSDLIGLLVNGPNQQIKA
jgi:CBS domain-containing protein